ncbi:hypothetical protein GCM10020220_051890 [Nonomuraea rubra]
MLEWCGGEEADVPLSALYEAEEAFLTSTTRDVQPIKLVDDTELPVAPRPDHHQGHARLRRTLRHRPEPWSAPS